MKKILSVLFLFLFCTSLPAEVHISNVNHIANRDPGLCSWASLETLSLTHGWSKIAGLTAGKKETDFHDNLVTEMKRLGVKLRYKQEDEQERRYFVIYQETEGSQPWILTSSQKKQEATDYIRKQNTVGRYWIQEASGWNLDFIRKSIKDDLGAAVSIDGYEAKGNRHWRHMLVVTDINDRAVKLVDSNYEAGTGTTYTMSLIKFMQMWCGFAIVIEKK